MCKIVATEVKHALRQLGYRLADDRIAITQISGGRYAVSVDGTNLGIWDSEKKTFVD